MSPPEFSCPLTDKSVQDGESFEINCTVKGDPEPHVTWTKNGKVKYSKSFKNEFFSSPTHLKAYYFQPLTQALTSSEAVDLKYKNGVATLKIGEIFPEDEGVYVCTATNSEGSVETSCKLTVKRKRILR